ncbi:DEAD/DEAH box helicase [Coralliovum pocilloporae]|uniref:DEAD/DEAH box helicase n=1 Tax=Coralliovum pocilloporae TaxID=3066369 RepID=UPI0033072F39
MSFTSLGLSDKVLNAVEKAGYETPTPIQAEAIPHVLSRRDVLGVAQTGTGKTASFTLPMLTLLEKGRARARMPRTLILEPTRELAAQVEQNFDQYGINHKLTVALLIGGVSFDEQERKLMRGADVLIATPGRLLDHFERGKLLLTGVELLVIDEADRMLDMGFIPDIERICKLVPFTRQTLFFSATMPGEIQRLTEQFLQNPVKVEVAPPASTSKNVTQKFVSCSATAHEKREQLRSLLHSAEELKNAIVFCNRKRDVGIVFRSLEKHGFPVATLHGDMDQHQRMAMLDKFKSGELSILVASDVAARGLDIPAVSHVFNFDVPTHADDYVHRIGRTGRAGRSGAAFTLVTPAEKKYVDAIQKLTGDDIDWAEGQPAQAEADDKPKRGKGSRKGGKRKAPEQAASAEQAPVAETSAQPVRDEQPQKTGRKNRNASRRRERDEPTPVGLGDHVPAFLLRPIRPQGKTASKSTDTK